MNCRRFKDELFEYVEGTLSADALAGAQKHLAGCHACREAVKREQRIETALFSRLRQTSQSLMLHPDIRRNILAACGQKSPAPIEAGSLIDLCKYWLRMAAIPVAMLFIAGIFLAIHFSGGIIVSTPVTSRLQPPISVQISYCLPQHEFYRKENTVVDAFVNETVVIDGTIPCSSPKNFPRKPGIKTPL